jgi:hypothetical protein
MFYTYLWLREDGTPYYVGKGKGNRAYKNHRIGKAPLGRIVIYPAESEADAFETEVALIWYYGRKDTGAGCLRNLTDGGEGVAGNNKPKTLEHRLNIGKAHKGMKRSARARANIAKAGVGKHNHTEEWKKQHSECLKGRKRPPRSKEWVENYKHSMKEYWERNK